MMPEQLPDVIQDEGFKHDADLYVKALLRRRTFRINGFELELHNLLMNAYMQGLATGYRHGLLIAENRQKRYGNK